MKKPLPPITMRPPSPDGMTRLALSMSRDLRAELDAYARRTRQSRALIIEDALQFYLTRKRTEEGEK